MIILGISLVGLFQENRVSLLLLLYIPIAVIVGTVISFALGVGTAAIGFWTHQIREIQVFTLYASFNAANYPVSLYPREPVDIQMKDPEIEEMINKMY